MAQPAAPSTATPPNKRIDIDLIVKFLVLGKASSPSLRRAGCVICSHLVARHHAGIHGRLLRVAPLPATAEIPDERYAALDQLSLRVRRVQGREKRCLRDTDAGVGRRRALGRYDV